MAPDSWRYNAARLEAGELSAGVLVRLVRAAQSALGVDIDGKCGPATVRALVRSQLGASSIADFIELALLQEGKPYVFGAEVDLSDPDPDAFDCSELVEWLAAQVGVFCPDGSWRQLKHCHYAGLELSVERGVDTAGALLFRFVGNPFGARRPRRAHVAISLGDGRTIEAKSPRDDVGVFSAQGRGWTHAGLLPGLNY